MNETFDIFAVLNEKIDRLQRSGSWREALDCWHEMKERFPDRPTGYIGTGIALQQLGDFAGADGVLLSACILFPTHHGIAVEYARVAHRQSRWQEALDRWVKVMENFSDSPDAIAGAGAALQSLGELERADDLLKKALEIAFVRYSGVAVEYARVAHRRGDWAEALRRWEYADKCFPGTPDCIAGLGDALQHLGRLEEADARMAAALSCFPEHAPIAIEYARVAHRRREWPEALLRWEYVCERFPTNAEGVSGVVAALEMLGDVEKREAILESAVLRFPDRVSFAIDYARVAHQRRDWPESLRRWTIADERFPDNQEILEGIGSSRFQDSIDQIDNEPRHFASSGVRSVSGGSRAQLAPSELLMQFESLGSGCEFGIVQRHFGAEPLGLLRWGAIPPLSLAKCLDENLAGVGNPEDVKIFEFGDSKEYFFRDTKYSLEMHTFVPVEGSDYDRVFNQQCRRARFLSEKLLADLMSSGGHSKIFVYKRHVGCLSDLEAMTIYNSIRRYGPHTLLCMRPEDDHHPNGTVVEHRDGLLIGYIDGLSPTSNAPEIKYDSWLNICSSAYDRWITGA